MKEDHIKFSNRYIIFRGPKLMHMLTLTSKIPQQNNNEKIMYL
jgi:hypothetical protein